MSVLEIKGLSHRYDDKVLFHDADLQINNGEHVGIVGLNGAGKSTFINILAGEVLQDEGEVRWQNNIRKTYLDQHAELDRSLTVMEYLKSSFRDLFAMNERMEALYAGMGEISDPDRLDEMIRKATDLTDRLTEAGFFELEANIKKIANGLGVMNFGYDTVIGTLSGGQRAKLMLAKLLLDAPDVMMLDEPTNYLDADGRERLYNLIRRTSATVLVISHDRTLLNQLPAICELSSQGLTYYSGNYDFYKKQKALQQKALTQQLEEKQKALRLARKVAREVEERKAKQNVRGEKNSIKKGIPRIMMGALKNNAENSSSRLSSIHTEKTEKLQAEMSGIKSSLPQTDKLKTDFNASHLHVGKVLVKAKDVNFHYPSLAASPMETTRPEAVKELWSSSLTFQLRSGDRLSLKGKNGSGKTTLLKLIMGELHPTGGVMERADFTSVYLDQEYSLVRNERSVLQQAEAFNHRHLPEHEVKTILNRYLFPHDVWNKPCSKLSGGEKMRLSFCCLMIADNTPDMFILDEPTNNLDIESIEIITATIRDYAGTVIAISHDREFLKDTGIEREILLE